LPMPRFKTSNPLRKVVYEGEENEVRYEEGEGARLHFIKFETKHIDQCLDYISSSLEDNVKDMTVWQKRNSVVYN